MHRLQRQSGMTLTGLMVGMTLGVLVLSGISAVYLLTVRAAAETFRSALLGQELRAVMEVMQLDIRRAGYWAFPAGADPADNPFQSTIQGIVNDLRTGEFRGEARGSCLTYSYDMNANTTIGFCGGCSSGRAPFDAAPYDRSNVEMFGFRLREGAVQMRARLASGSEVAFDCNSGHWEGVTSEEVRITDLRFTVTIRSQNLNPAKPSTSPCTTNDLCQRMRAVEVLLAGQLAADPNVRKAISSSIAVRNDRYGLE
jgi:prepilin peptidase dependent protein B